MLLGQIFTIEQMQDRKRAKYRINNGKISKDSGVMKRV